MTTTTILEKFKIIYEVSKSSGLFIAILAFLALLAIVSLKTNKNNAKKSKRLYLLVYVIVGIFIVLNYYESFGKMFTYMMDNFFIVVYFPNLAIYLAAIIITNIILLVSVFNFKTTKIVRNINIIVYSIIHYLFTLVLNVINKNNLDIFSQNSVYANKEAHALIELTSTIFVIWIIFLVLYKIIRRYQQKQEVPVKQKVIVRTKRRLPTNINKVKVPARVKGQPKKIKEEVKKPVIEEPIIIAQLTEPIKVDATETLMKNLDSMLTLEDYKVLLTLLKTQQKKDKQKEEQLLIEEEQVKIS